MLHYPMDESEIRVLCRLEVGVRGVAEPKRTMPLYFPSVQIPERMRGYMPNAGLFGIRLGGPKLPQSCA